MVAAVRKKQPMRSVAARFHVTLRTVQRWVNHAKGKRLDRVDWSDKRGGRREERATPRRVEDRILEVRKKLRDESDLGEYGAEAIHRELSPHRKKLRLKSIPSERTIGRILERRGVLDGRARVRRPPPPKGWYLPELRERRAELDSFDFVEGLVLPDGSWVEVLNGMSLHGGLSMSCVRGGSWTAKATVPALLTHWQTFGLPDYAQFDNDTIFQGSHRGLDAFGRVTRLCLQLGLTPGFAPPREMGFQAAIESYNGRWQAKVWSRFKHTSLGDLVKRSERYVAASHQRSASRIDSAPTRWMVPEGFKLDLSRPLSGLVIFIRRTNEKGQVQLLGRDYEVSSNWCHRLVRCDVDLTAERLQFRRLRRREPTQQPVLKTLAYKTPTKRFHG